MTTIEEQRTMQAIQQLNRKVPEVTLRDLFAMSYLNGILTNRAMHYDYDQEAVFAYRVADAMLEARKK